MATAEGDIPSRVERIGTEMDGEDGSDRGQNRQRDWWTAWTGLKASRFKTGFFSHVRPTLTNQAGIAGALANLCCDRAAIIEQGRNNALYWIEWATKSLGQGEVQVTDLTEGWKTLQGVGSTIGLTAPWVPGAAKLGAAMTVIGFLGEKLFPHVSQEGYKHSVPEVVTEIKSRIRELNEYLDGNERAYELAASRLRSIVASIPRDDLELYDLTRNDPAGEPDRGSGFEVDVATVFQLSADCYRVAAQYEQILPKIASTAHCDKYLSDKDGIPTSGDRDFLIVRDVLQQSLKVTCDRYSVAGDQIRIAAHEYQRVEGVNQDYFDRHMRDFEGAVDYQ